MTEFARWMEKVATTGLTAVLWMAGCAEEPASATTFGGTSGTGTSTTTGVPPASSSSPSTGSPSPDPSSGSDTTATSGAEPPIIYDVGTPERPWEPDDDLPKTCDELDTSPATSVGCRFYGLDVPGAGTWPYGISVGNPSDETAVVVLEDLRGPNGSVREITTVTLEPGHSELIEVNGVYDDGVTGGILFGEDHTAAPSEPPYEGDLFTLPAMAFRVTSDVPITAMQIGPVGGGPSAVAEASMLLPVNALDTAYRTIGYPAGSGPFGESSSWVLVAATQDATTVTTPYGEVMLDEFDTAYVAAGSDASGLFITADAPVAVFSGAPCLNVGGQYCDHIEEQVFPLSSWGKQYVGARHPARVPEVNPNVPEPVYWRVYGAVDGTSIELQPPHPELGANIEVDAGTWVEFSTPQSFVATSDDPFLLVQYMSGCRNVLPLGSSCAGWTVASGDPYMAQMVPVEQWITMAPFLTDTSYPRDFVVIAKRTGTKVNLACLGELDEARFQPIEGTIFEVGHVDLDIGDQGGEGDCVDGAQFLTASDPIGILVGGVDYASSYGYPGGMFLNPTWVPPAG